MPIANELQLRWMINSRSGDASPARCGCGTLQSCSPRIFEMSFRHICRLSSEVMLIRIGGLRSRRAQRNVVSYFCVLCFLGSAREAFGHSLLACYTYQSSLNFTTYHLMSMLAAAIAVHGSAERIQVQQVAIPIVGDLDALIKVHAFAINPVRMLVFLFYHLKPFISLQILIEHRKTNFKYHTNFKHPVLRSTPKFVAEKAREHL